MDAGAHRFEYMVPVHVAIPSLPRVAGIKGLFTVASIQGMPCPADKGSHRINGTPSPLQEDTRGVVPDPNLFLTTLASGKDEDMSDSFF
jgi:hypothetical protein